MIYVADTMAIVLLIEGRTMTAAVQKIFFDALAKQHTIYVPAISIIEIGYLHEKGRIEASINDVKELPDSFKIAELTFDIISAAFSINDIPELHDRLVAATAKHLKVPVITNDPVISGSEFVTSIWK
jgi:PIN domain nuclease of toxin-antitoxin system